MLFRKRTLVGVVLSKRRILIRTGNLIRTSRKMQKTGQSLCQDSNSATAPARRSSLKFKTKIMTRLLTRTTKKTPNFSSYCQLGNLLSMMQALNAKRLDEPLIPYCKPLLLRSLSIFSCTSISKLKVIR